MIRALVFLIIALIAVAAVLASNHEKQIAIDQHSSGRWDFNNAASSTPASPLTSICITHPLRTRGLHQA